MEESFQEKVPTPNFDIEKSPIKEAYVLLDAKTPLELSNRYSAEDQKLMQSGAWEWDYENEELLINKVKNILESADVSQMTDEERDWRNEILWFWYHHAISCAIWRYQDKEAAKKYAAVALEYQGSNHPNKITRLLDLLTNDKLPEAEQWAEGIEDGAEKETAQYLLKEYREGDFDV